jgi:predicted MFS family arabinose efflux permease
VNYIALGLGWGSAFGARYWVVYGLAAIAGPILTGKAIDHIGAVRSYRIGLVAQVLATAAMVASTNIFVMGAATAVFGFVTPGMVALTLARIHEILPNDHNAQRAAWSNATTAFALFQMLGGYFYAWLFAHTDGDYTFIFTIATASMTLAFLVNLYGAWTERKDARVVVEPAE